MRPAPIPNDAIWPGAVRRVYSAPDGDLLNEEIAPVEALVDDVPSGLRASVRCVLEDGDLEKLAAGGHVWISFYGLMPVFSVDVTDAKGQ